MKASAKVQQILHICKFLRDFFTTASKFTLRYAKVFFLVKKSHFSCVYQKIVVILSAFSLVGQIVPARKGVFLN